MNSLSSTTSKTQCSSCGQKGKSVKIITLESLLKPQALERLTEGPYRFCDSTQCDTVYFAEDGSHNFTKSDLTVRVGVKETSGSRSVCYCFDHTIEGIEDEVERTGKSTALDDIKSRMKDGCWCETKSPMGGCCLGTVSKYEKLALAGAGHVVESNKNEEFEDCCASENKKSGSTASAHDCCAPKPGVKAGGRQDGVRGQNSIANVQNLSVLGSVVAAIAASACCWLPLLLLAFGVSGVAVSSTLEQYRPLFMALTLGCLGSAFYFVYRPQTAASSGSEESCCPPENAKAFSVKKANKIMLWVFTPIALAFVFFPNYVGAIMGNNGSELAARSDLEKMAVKIEGMTCEACAVSIQENLITVPGVKAAEVSYAKKEALIGFPVDTKVSREDILAAISKAGYKGQFKDLKEWVIPIEGMTCAACATHVQGNLSKITGVNSANVDYDTKKAVVLANPDVAKEALNQAVEKAGYKVSGAGANTNE